MRYIDNASVNIIAGSDKGSLRFGFFMKRSETARN